MTPDRRDDPTIKVLTSRNLHKYRHRVGELYMGFVSEMDYFTSTYLITLSINVFQLLY